MIIIQILEAWSFKNVLFVAPIIYCLLHLEIDIVIFIECVSQSIHHALHDLDIILIVRLIFKSLLSAKYGVSYHPDRPHVAFLVVPTFVIHILPIFEYSYRVL